MEGKHAAIIKSVSSCSGSKSLGFENHSVKR